MRNSFVLLIALLFVGFAVGMRAQQTEAKPASDQPVATLKVKAREVLLPVTVRDKHGAMVTNLTAADFTLTEDGRPQTIKSFTRESNLPFRLGLVVDTSRSMSSAMDSERKAAGKFIDLMLPENPDNAKKGDEAFLIHFDREVELLEDFTNSREKLHHELDDMGPTPQERHSASGPETSGDDRGGYGGRAGRGHGGTQLYDAIYLAADELMKSKDGRKALVVFSDGADHGSKETLNDAVDAADRANLTVYAIYFKGQEERNENPFSGGRRGGMGGGMPGGGGGYPGGGGGYPGGGGGRRGGDQKSDVDGRKIMEKIATRTGGRYFEAKKKDNLEDIYNQIADELRNQYLLTYTPDKTSDSDDEFHKIALKAKKDDLTVATREGYYTADK
jgi:VWFA-related protein